MAANIKVTTDSKFEADVLKSGNPVLVDFWAEWCGPCKALAPKLEEIAGEMTGKVTVAKLNVDENPGVPGQFGIRGIPTLILFKNGQTVATKVGSLAKPQLISFLEANI